MSDNLVEIICVLQSKVENLEKVPNVPLMQFHGKLSENVRDWLFNCEQLLFVHSVLDSRMRALLAGAALREQAVSWYKNLSTEDSEDYDKFKAAIKARFSATKSQFQL